MSEDDSSDSDCPVPAFPIPESDSDVPPDLQKALTSPEEFIKYVRHEAESYPDVFFSHVPSDVNECNAAPPMSDQSVFKQANNSSNAQEADWLAQFNETVEEYQFCKTILSEDRTPKVRLTTQQLTSPALLDTVPSLTWIAERGRVELDSLLQLVASHCTKKRWKPNFSVWIFALLVALEKPIDPDTCHTLRTIAKRCRKLQKELADSLSDSETRLFNLYPFLVARVFGQLDLLDS